MPRIRTIKPEFYDDQKLKRVPIQGRYLFIALWVFADDEGIVIGDPQWLKSKIFPYDEDMRTASIESWMLALTNALMLVPFTYQQESYYVIRSFKKHQRVDKPYPSRIPKDIIDKALTEFDERSTNVLRMVGERSPLEIEVEKEIEDKSSCPEIGISDVVSLPFEAPIPIPSKPKPKEKHYSAEGYSFAQWFRVLLPAERSVTKNDLVNWAITYDELIRIDKRSDADIRRVCKWARENSFWKDNFLSATKLRDKDSGGVKYFEVFQIRMNRERGIYNGRSTNVIQGNGEQLTDILTREREDTADAIRAVKIALGEVD